MPKKGQPASSVTTCQHCRRTRIWGTNQDNRSLMPSIMRAAANTRAHGVVIHLQWMSEHFKVPRNDAADQLAREAATLAKLIHSPLCCRGRKLPSRARSAPSGKKNGKSPERAATAGLSEALICFRKWYTLPIHTQIYLVVLACISLRWEVRVNNTYLPTYLMYGNIFYSEELRV